MQVILGFTFSTSLVGFIIWPKTYAWACERFGVKSATKVPHINVSGSSDVRVSGVQGSSSRKLLSNSHASATEAPTSQSVNSRDVQYLQKQNSKLELRVAELEEELLAGSSKRFLQHTAESIEQPKQQEARPSFRLGAKYEI